MKNMNTVAVEFRLVNDSLDPIIEPTKKIKQNQKLLITKITNDRYS